MDKFVEIEDLLTLKEHGQIVLKLQEIMKRLLLETEIRINANSSEAVIIEPVLIEAYYYKKGVFEDNFVHKNEDLQKKNYGKLYIHQTGKGKDAYPILENRGGIDLCLSDREDYFLSFLIREGYVTAEGKTVYVDGPGRMVKYLSGQSFGTKKNKQKLKRAIITKDNIKKIEEQNVLFNSKNIVSAPIFNTIRINLNYNRKEQDASKRKKEQQKEKYVFALLGAIKGM